MARFFQTEPSELIPSLLQLDSQIFRHTKGTALTNDHHATLIQTVPGEYGHEERKLNTFTISTDKRSEG